MPHKGHCFWDNSKMAETALTVISASRLNPQIVDEADPVGDFEALDEPNGNSFTNINNRIICIIKNTTANELTATFEAASTYSGIDLPDEAVAIPANDLCIIGPFPNEDFGSGAANKTVLIAWSGTAPAGKILVLDVTANNA